MTITLYSSLAEDDNSRDLLQMIVNKKILKAACLVTAEHQIGQLELTLENNVMLVIDLGISDRKPNIVLIHAPGARQ